MVNLQLVNYFIFYLLYNKIRGYRFKKYIVIYVSKAICYIMILVLYTIRTSNIILGTEINMST